MLEAAEYTCPHCFSRVETSVSRLDATRVDQVEDCEVCCAPLRLRGTLSGSPPFVLDADPEAEAVG